MRRWVPYPFVRFVIYFIIGILVGIYFEGMFRIVLILLLVSVVVYLVLQFLSSRNIHHYFSLPTGVFGFLILLSLGYINVSLFDEKNNTDHVLHLQEPKEQNYGIFQARLLAPLEEKENSVGTLVDIEAVLQDKSWTPSSGRVLLYIKKDSILTDSTFSYGDLVLFKGTLRRIEKPLNPDVFDYSAYLRYQNIFHNAFVSFEDIILCKEGSNFSFYGSALDAQQKLAKIISDNIENAEAESIILSLVLGHKDDLENNIQDAYSTAGVMHILAVSGLHVAIIYSILLFTLSWLNKGNYRWVFALICIAVLWAYAFITGLSPSVLRAVTMFSSLIIAKAFGKNNNIYNAIAASAFFLLCYNPFFIMSVGFQLSYIAVLGIIFLYSKFYNILTVEYRLLDAIWKSTCVSLAAQIAVLPLSIFYFHQFPLYFLVANLVIIPASFLMLALGICLLAFHFVPFIGPLIGDVLEALVVYANKFVYFIENLPNSKLDGLYIDGMQVMLLFAILIGILWFISTRKFYILIFIAFLFICFQTIFITHHWSTTNEKLIVYYRTKQTGIIGLFDGNFSNLYITGGGNIEKEDFEYNIKPSLMVRGADSNPVIDSVLVQKEGIESQQFKYGLVLAWNGKKIMIINKSLKNEWQLNKVIRIDFLILEENAVENLKEIPANLKFKKLILGNSNSYKVINKLERAAKAEKMNVVSPKKEGALIVHLKEEAIYQAILNK